MNIASWLITHSTVLLKLLIGFLSTIHGQSIWLFLLIRCICHVKMQLNDVIKSIGCYQAFVNSTSTNTSTGIGASLLFFKIFLRRHTSRHPSISTVCILTVLRTVGSIWLKSSLFLSTFKVVHACYVEGSANYFLHHCVYGGIQAS